MIIAAVVSSPGIGWYAKIRVVSQWQDSRRPPDKVMGPTLPMGPALENVQKLQLVQSVTGRLSSGANCTERITPASFISTNI